MIKPIQKIKPVVTEYRFGDKQKLASFTVQNDLLGELQISTQKSDVNPTGFITYLKNRFDKILGIEVFSIDNESAHGFNIEVNSEYRRKRFRFGEILRLNSIIEIIENKVKTFEIYSKDTAVYFHSKYKFEPSMRQFSERDSALNSIIKNCDGEFKPFGQKAQELLDKIIATDNPAKQREIRGEVNILVRDYIQKVLNHSKDEYKKHPFERGMSMTLSIDNIMKNKDFFNKLFEKHNIDYRI